MSDIACSVAAGTASDDVTHTLGKGSEYLTVSGFRNKSVHPPVFESYRGSLRDEVKPERAENKAKMEKNKSGWVEAPQGGIWAQDVNSAKNLPVEKNPAFAPDYSITKDNFEEKIRELQGVKKTEEIYMPFKDTLTGFNYNIHLDPTWLSNHIQGKGKSRFANLPMYLETLRNPSEIRIRFMKSLKTGKSAIRTVFWKRFMYGDEDFAIEVVSDASQANEFKVWTNYADNSKAGKMMLGVPIYQKP